MNFSESVYTIESAVRKFGFPVVVRSENACSGRKRRDEQAEYFENRLKLPYGSITMLERKVTLQFAHVTVMEFRDPDAVQNDKGIDFIESHSEYEDDDYLLPLTFEGKCEIVHPPGKRKRYVNVEQLFKDLPRFIRINDQLVSLNTDNDDVVVIPAGDVLEIINVKLINTTRFLICKDKAGKSIMIAEETPVNITAVDDTNKYTLEELISSDVYLPKCVEFEDISPYDIVIFDDFWAHHLLVMSAGPFRVNSLVEMEVILGWCIPIESDGTVRSHRTVLIPKNKWKNQNVKVRLFKKDADRMVYTKKHFPASEDSEYIDRKFFLGDAETYPGLIWLQNRQPVPAQPVWYPRDSRDHSAFRPPSLHIETEALPDSDLDDDYIEPIPAPEPGPPLPPRSPKVEVELPTRIQKPDSWKEVLEKIQAKAKSGFDKVHDEIHNLFRQKSGEDRPPGVHPRPSGKSLKQTVKGKCEQQAATEQTAEKLRASANKEGKKTKTSKLGHSFSVDETREKTKKKEVERSNSSASASTNRDFYYVTPSNEDGTYEIETETESQSKNDEENAITKRPRMPLPDVPEKGSSQTDTFTPEFEPDHEYDYPDVTGLAKMERDKARGYVGIDVDEVDRVSRDNQTKEDFYGYSVDEVVKCFELVALPDIAKTCKEERFNGRFFENLSENDIKTYFNLDVLHFIKVRKTIFEGWRPR